MSNNYNRYKFSISYSVVELDYSINWNQIDGLYWVILKVHWIINNKIKAKQQGSLKFSMAFPVGFTKAERKDKKEEK